MFEDSTDQWSLWMKQFWKTWSLLQELFKIFIFKELFKIDEWRLREERYFVIVMHPSVLLKYMFHCRNIGNASIYEVFIIPLHVRGLWKIHRVPLLGLSGSRRRKSLMIFHFFVDNMVIDIKKNVFG